MRHFAIFLTLGLAVLARANGDYVLELDGKQFEIPLDTTTNLVLQNGQTVSATLKRKEFITFEGQLFSFEHKSNVTPQQAQIETGISQTSLMISSVGGIIIVQEYTHINPVPTIDHMIGALTKKDVAAGYEMTQEKTEKRLADGTVMKGKVVTTKLGDKQWIRNVLAAGGNGQGVLVVTQVSAKHIDEDAPIIDVFWKSLRIKLPQ